MDTIALSCEKLSKRYGKSPQYAIRDLTFSVHTGEVYGFLGPNGAGKSTAIRTLLNFIQPTAGQATILGLSITADSVRIRQHIGYLSGDFSAYQKLTGEEFLTYLSELQPPKSVQYKNTLATLFHANLHKRIGDLSKGNRQKLGIIQAFMHQPDVYILDEPTDGLDPLMQETFYQLVRSVKEQGASVFISSHNLSEVRKMCDRVGIIQDGKLVGEYDIADLAQEASQTFDVSFNNKVSATQLRNIVGVKKVTGTGPNFSLHVHGSLSPLLLFLGKQEVRSLASRELNLEEQFMKFYKTDTKR